MKKTFFNLALLSSLILSSELQAKNTQKNKIKKSENFSEKTVKNDEEKTSQNVAVNTEISSEEKTTSKNENSQSLTQGHIVGFNLIGTRTEYRESFTDNDTTQPTKKNWSFKDSNKDGFDLNYKYAFNFNKIFVAPGFFYEKTKAKIIGGKSYDPSYNYNEQFVKINNRFGLKTDIGYDFHDKFSPYLTGGISRISYTTKNYVSYTGGSLIGNAIKNDREYEWFYGFGVKSNLSENISLNLEYQRQDFTANTTLGSFSSYYPSYNGKYLTRIEFYKVGLGYSF